VTVTTPLLLVGDVLPLNAPQAGATGLTAKVTTSPTTAAPVTSVTVAVRVEVPLALDETLVGLAVRVTVFATWVCFTVLAAEELAPLASIAVTSQFPALVELV
jgi:hypothetical protein